jgi:hypothetical protein
MAGLGRDVGARNINFANARSINIVADASIVQFGALFPDLTLRSVAKQRVSKGEVARILQQRGHPTLRDASLRDAPQDEVGR